MAAEDCVSRSESPRRMLTGLHPVADHSRLRPRRSRRSIRTAAEPGLVGAGCHSGAVPRRSMIRGQPQATSRSWKRTPTHAARRVRRSAHLLPLHDDLCRSMTSCRSARCSSQTAGGLHGGGLLMLLPFASSRLEPRPGSGRDGAGAAPVPRRLCSGVIVFGIGLFYQQQVTNAAREAARYAAIHSATSECPTRSRRDGELRNDARPIAGERHTVRRRTSQRGVRSPRGRTCRATVVSEPGSASMRTSFTSPRAGQATAMSLSRPQDSPRGTHRRCRRTVRR